MKKIRSIALGLALAGAAIFAAAQTVAPQVSTINPGDLFQDVVNGQPQAGNQYAPASLFSATFGNGSPSRGNALIGGDATTNLWQRSTAGTTETTTVAYGSADRWPYWSGTSTAMKVIRDSTAADLPAGYEYAFKMQRTASQTGVVQMCMAQEVASVNSYQFQGQTAELDFHAYLGATYSGGSSLTAYIVYGTGVDEGTTDLAYGINAGGGGSVGWTGQANATAAVIPLSTVSTGGRYAAIGSIPATATEVGVAICYTPTGTAGSTDYVALAGIQLVRNPANTSFVNTGVGYQSGVTPNLTLAAFERRPAAQEAYYQYTYYQQWADSLAATFVLPETCTETTSGSTATCLFAFPVALRTTPTVAVATATSFGMTKVADGTAEACTTFAVISSTATPNNFKATCAVSETAAVGTMHIGLYANTGAANTLTVSSEL
jgi:hypothetical protein